MYQIADFTRQMKHIAHKWSNKHYANIAAELNAIATALGSDATTHDLSIQLPPAALKPGHGQTTFTNECLHLVNRGKAGNLANSAMAGAITGSLPADAPPVNTTAPAVTGTGTIGQNLTTTNGVWTNSPTSYSYQWLRGGSQIAGAVNAVYALVGADSGTSVSCRVTAINPAGNASALSNAVAVA